MLYVQTRQQGDAMVVAVDGKITFDVINRLNGALHDALSTGNPKTLVLNMEYVTFIDSSGVGLLVASRNIMNRNMGQLHLCGLCPRVMDVVTKMNLQNYFSIVATEQEALLHGSAVESHQVSRLA